ncbi:MAG: hypothetical protein DLM50_00455 [Candidatus Meridianibacter frigidus]|nr:MAG: hypothetical protein DLM50_00455 [Candidatus Eremiobacteraeota bacterium]
MSKRVLFVTNGHGEVAIGAHLAAQLGLTCDVQCDHLALVGDFAHGSAMSDVGPRRVMPSGGLLAMGNLRNWWADLRGGLLGHLLEQLRFARRVHGQYDAAIAVGDVTVLLLARMTRSRRLVFVGTAKSVFVAPYGMFEERVLAGADLVFVRDEPTAARLRGHRVPARAPGNIIADLFGLEELPRVATPFATTVAIFPGSRADAYGQARFLCAVVRSVAALRPGFGAWLSIAPGLRAERFAEVFAADGWEVHPVNDPQSPFALHSGKVEVLRAWTGEPGSLLHSAAVVLGQAGTANEAAAAAGIPILAFEHSGNRAHPWYRKRQRGLLGDAMMVVRGEREEAAAALLQLLDDPHRRARMGDAGRERMGARGGTRRVAQGIAELIGC